MDIKRARIVVVEDEAVMSTFILNNLRRIGILDLFAFTDGASAMKEMARAAKTIVPRFSGSCVRAHARPSERPSSDAFPRREIDAAGRIRSDGRHMGRG